jgi:hypothetical protein
VLVQVCTFCLQRRAGSSLVFRLCIRKTNEAGWRPRSATALRIKDSADDTLIEHVLQLVTYYHRREQCY